MAAPPDDRVGVSQRRAPSSVRRPLRGERFVVKRDVRWILRSGAALAVLALPSLARAQTPPGTSADFDVQTFWPTGGPTEHVALRSSTVSASGAVGAGLVVNFMRRPLLLVPAGMPQAAGVDWALTTDFLWSLGLFRRFQISAAIPVVVAQSGEGSRPVLGPRTSPLSETALRDIRVEASVALLQRARLASARGVGLRVDLGMAIPFGDEKGFNSSGGFTFAPMLVADWRTRYFTFTLNAGARLRETRTFADMAIGSSLVLAGGVNFHPRADSRYSFSADYFGTFALASVDGFRSPQTSELFLGARYATDVARDVEVFVGGAAPLNSQPLVPGWRAIAGVLYAPRGHDTDRDGIVDADDRCRTQAEDRDNFEDEDGCPDPDNDQDNVPDVNDRCADQAEDVDNFQDEDGCPDDDNDSDGVNDPDDQCPDEAAGDHPDPERAGCPVPDSDQDGVLDPDDRCVDVAAGTNPDPERAGCPMPDRDSDGIADNRDECPGQPVGATPDAYRRGCPDEDTDRDGVLGNADRCPTEPETINGVTDRDGCPDQGPARVTWNPAGDALRFVAPVVLPQGAQAVPPLLMATLQQAAQRVRARGSEVATVFIEVTPGPGAPGVREATRQAELVRDVFIAQRISQRMITARAATRPAPTAAFVFPGTVTIRVERRPPLEGAQPPATSTTPAATSAAAPSAPPPAAPAPATPATAPSP